MLWKSEEARAVNSENIEPWVGKQLDLQPHAGVKCEQDQM